MSTARGAIVVLATAAVVADLAGLAQPWRSVAVFAFLAAGPGLATLCFVNAEGRLPRAMLSVATSLAIAACVSEGLAIVHRWSATPLLVALAVASVLAGVLPGRSTP